MQEIATIWHILEGCGGVWDEATRLVRRRAGETLWCRLTIVAGTHSLMRTRMFSGCFGYFCFINYRNSGFEIELTHHPVSLVYNAELDKTLRHTTG